MKEYDIDQLASILKKSAAPIVLFGAGEYGKLALSALKNLAISVNYYCDDDIGKQNKKLLDIDVISPESLAKLGSDVHVFICTSYAIEAIVSRFKKIGLNNIHSCIKLFEATNFDGNNLGINQSKIKRRMELYKAECTSIREIGSEKLDIKYIDIVITESCSMKCESCSNLMQYYIKPRNSEYDLLIDSVDKIMRVINTLFEFRILGGEPFVNKKIGNIVNRLTEYKNAKNIVIYTNATIIPKGENLECLKNKNVFVEITNYGKLSKNHDELVELFQTNNIKYSTTVPKWTDSGTINFQAKTEEKLLHMFKNCCVNDVLTLLNGNLYRCPFSANAMNLKAIPINNTDVVNLSDDNKTIDFLAQEITALYKHKDYLTACSYCNGRDYSTPEIDAAIQVSKPITVPVIPKSEQP
jgi:organic radical activating enzyme